MPEGESSEQVTEIETAPDPDTTPHSEGNVSDTGASGPMIEVPRGSKAKVPRTSRVRVVDSDEEEAAGDEREKADEGDS